MYDRALYQRLARLGPDGQRAAFAAAVRHDDDDLARCVLRREDAPDDVAAAARDSGRPAVRAAWLLRPGRTRDELVAAVDRERRGEVLAAVAAATDDAGLRRRLARTGKRPVALVLADSDDDEVLAEVLPVLDAWCGARSANAQVRAAARSAAARADEAVLAQVADRLGSLEVLAAVARRDPSRREVLDRLVTHLVPLAQTAVRSWGDDRITAAAALAALAEGPYMAGADLQKVADATAGTAGLALVHRRAAERAAQLGDAPVLGPDELAGALAGDDPDRVRAAWSRCTPAQRAAHAATAGTNPAAPRDVVCEAVQVDHGLFDRLAGAVDVATCVAVGRAGGLCAVLERRADVRAEVVAGLLDAGTVYDLVQWAGALTDDELLDGPWGKVGRAGLSRVDAHVVAAFDGHAQAWEMFDRLQGAWPGSARGLVDTCRAAVS